MAESLSYENILYTTSISWYENPISMTLDLFYYETKILMARYALSGTFRILKERFLKAVKSRRNIHFTKSHAPNQHKELLSM